MAMRAEVKNKISLKDLLQWMVVLVIAYVLYKAVVVLQTTKPVQIIQQPQQATAPTTVEYSDTGILGVSVSDIDGNAIANLPVELWTVANVENITNVAFYATEGYSVFASGTTDGTGYVEFSIPAAKYASRVVAAGQSLYAVALPDAGNLSGYYREGKEVTGFGFDTNVNKFIAGKDVVAMNIELPKVADLIVTYTPTIDIVGLEKDDTYTDNLEVVKVHPNSEGILRIYKIKVLPGADLSNLTAQFDYLKVKVGDEEIVLIEDGEVKLTDPAGEEIEFPYVELKPGDKFTVTIDAMLSADADATLDGMKAATIQVYDVRDQLITAADLEVNTAI